MPSTNPPTKIAPQMIPITQALSPTQAEQDAHFLHQALAAARQAGAAGEVPVGAVVVHNGQIIATGHNAPIGLHDPTAHAEMQALRSAAAAQGNYRLSECDVYVSLEPCAMCAGALINARVRRVVFATPEPKTGAGGSVLNLFANTQINHQTELINATQLGAAYADSVSLGGQLMQEFFAKKRLEQRAAHHPLREDALRTPDACFADLPGYPWPPHYMSDLAALNGLRLHYLDEGAASPDMPHPTQTTYLCLHGNPAWSYLYRKMMPIFLHSGARVVAPDMVGFGKSDKPKKDSFHTFSWHRQCLGQLVERLDLHNVVLVVQDWGGLLGLTLPMDAPQRYKGLLVMNTTLATGDQPLTPGFIAWREMCAAKPGFDIAKLFARGNPHLSAPEAAAYMAPYPDEGHRAATRAFPPMVPDAPDADGAAISRQALAFWQTRWTGQTLMAIGQQDPVLGEATMRALQAQIRQCPPPMLLPDAGHFVQERGEAVAQQAVRLWSGG